MLDRELAVFDESLVSRFHMLNAPPDPAQTVTPPVLIAFDCLHVRGRDVRMRLLTERREILEDVVAESNVLPVRRLPADGMQAWAVCRRVGSRGSWQKIRVRRTALARRRDGAR